MNPSNDMDSSTGSVRIDMYKRGDLLELEEVGCADGENVMLCEAVFSVEIPVVAGRSDVATSVSVWPMLTAEVDVMSSGSAAEVIVEDPAPSVCVKVVNPSTVPIQRDPWHPTLAPKEILSWPGDNVEKKVGPIVYSVAAERSHSH